MVDFPLGGREKDFDSKKSRGRSINLIPKMDREGTYVTYRRTEGLTLFASGMESPVRSDLLVNGGFIYLVSGSKFYRVDSAGATTVLGTVNGSGRAKIAANAIPGDSEIVILNGSGVGYIYSVALGFLAISDADFKASSSVTVLNERFWFVRDGTNEVFGSNVSDGSSYNPLTFAAAEESPDLMVAIIAKKSALWLLNTNSAEYWQTQNNITLPIRRVNGASKEFGIAAINSLANINDYFAFFANDRTVRLMKGSELVEISDLDFTLRVRGNGTSTFPGFKTITDAYGFFVNSPVHSTYYLTFPSEGFTWGYDLKTGMSHTRESGSLGYWRANSAVEFNAQIICGDQVEGKLYILDQSNKTENNADMRATLITPHVSSRKNMTIPLIEMDMEVAQSSDPDLNPQMLVSYTKDGGYTYTNKSSVSLGKMGEHKTRVPIRHFGRVVRNKDFGLKLEVVDPVGVHFYSADYTPEIDV